MENIVFENKQQLAEFLRAEIDTAMKGAAATRSRDDLRADMEIFGDIFGKFVNKPLPIKGSKRFKSEALNDTHTHKAVTDFLRGQLFPNANEYRAAHAEAVKAMSIGTLADGGYLTPASFREEVLYVYGNFSKFREIATVVPMDSAKLDWPLASATPTMYWPGDNTAITDSKPTLGVVNLVAQLGGVLVYLPRQLAASSRIDIVALLASLMGESFAEGELEAFTNGNGTAKPKGFRDTGYTSIPKSNIASTALASADLVTAQYLIAEKYRARGVYVFPSAVEALIMKLTDASSGRPIWVPAMADGKPATVFGKPYVINDKIPTNLGVGTNETEIWFGAFGSGGYVIGDQELMTVESSTDGGTAFPAHQLAVKGVVMVDGKVGNQLAIGKMEKVK